ncbi:MAG: putative lipopolysaccharide biosynthesis protein [Myxococcales bacterium]|nr:putative lipopolysaccharide biosynthesis protein [Myxococcales bacterium]
MCGIFGVICSSEQGVDRDLARALAISLLRHSETRGREAAGIAVHDGEHIQVLKQGGSVSEFLANPKLHELLDRALAKFEHGRTVAITGHSRLATNGAQSNVDNNQPVITHGSVALHNGIVVNDRVLSARYPTIAPRSELDTEVLAGLLRTKLDVSHDLVAATRETFAEIEGSASIAMLFDNLDVMLLATNTGSLFQLSNEAGNVIAFASERFILQRVLEEKQLSAKLGTCRLEQIRAGHALAIQLEGLKRRAFSLAPANDERPFGDAPNGHHVEIVDYSSHVDRLKRCTKCILPSTFPYVAFDENGVCAYCRTWKTIQPKGAKALEELVEPYRSKDGSPDVIVAFSGGRDSSYGLHYVKKVLGMNPIAFTYDWGMVTDLARRNCARVCGKLGVEHIIRSADITAKRRYVRKNIEAWLKKPELGMVTLFMAGDKEFYAHARQLRKETGIKLVIFCTGNLIEEARYKTGLMGVPQDDDDMVLTNMSLRNKAGMLWYFAKNYLKNPAYINESLLDTANAFYQTFMVKDDFLYLYHYLPWHEDEIVGTIRREYDWEVATDTQTTWRIGDGTAAFYNYIYGTIAGFTEDESMLSNMVREGHLTREEALIRGREYSKPRWASIREYAQLIGFSAEEALQIINATPKLY